MLTTIITLLTYMLTYPLWAAVMTVIYYDLRVRNEGFDLQLLAQGVGADASRFETSPERPDSPPPPTPEGGGFRPPEEPATSSSIAAPSRRCSRAPALGRPVRAASRAVSGAELTAL